MVSGPRRNSAYSSPMPSRPQRLFARRLSVSTPETLNAMRICMWSWRLPPTPGSSRCTATPLGLQQRARSDTGDLQQVRRADGARRQDELARDLRPRVPSLAAEFEPARAPAVEEDPLRPGAGQHGQVGAALRRPQEAARRVPAGAAALVDREFAGALIVAVVEVGRGHEADVRAGALEGIEDVPANPGLLPPAIPRRCRGTRPAGRNDIPTS